MYQCEDLYASSIACVVVRTYDTPKKGAALGPSFDDLAASISSRPLYMEFGGMIWPLAKAEGGL